MFSRLDRRAAVLGLVGLLLLTAAFIAFIYVVSPLRKPTFQPNSANAGTLISGL
ncbi:hypothetical protein [Thermocoleostomius sinensis]|uniref:Uncharacterized protein n=1 Tax=Thermocoleostomius sinensis A174 TaxID=2016057 RepID=A0A9E9C996_9CYAN|nr:hypothetical protein [Thermocoleostomius sinensis]WAL62374.1 hypothetical protein OXH18_10405 [Thermocoleostomius sinensis A174]